MSTSGDIRADGWDRSPTFELSAEEYERTVVDLVNAAGPDVTDVHVQHLDQIDGVDGSFIIDVTVRFRVLGLDYLTLFECKRHASPVKREHVQVLNDKVRSIGAQKGVMVSASGYQRGALEYAEKHRIACVRLVDDAWTYEVRSEGQPIPIPSGKYCAFRRYLTEGGWGTTRLTDLPEYIREALFDDQPASDSE